MAGAWFINMFSGDNCHSNSILCLMSSVYVLLTHWIQFIHFVVQRLLPIMADGRYCLYFLCVFPLQTPPFFPHFLSFRWHVSTWFEHRWWHWMKVKLFRALSDHIWKHTEEIWDHEIDDQHLHKRDLCTTILHSAQLRHCPLVQTT